MRRRWRREPKQCQSSNIGSCDIGTHDICQPNANAAAHYGDQHASTDTQQYGHPTPNKQHADECVKRHSNALAHADANRHADPFRQHLQRV